MIIRDSLVQFIYETRSSTINDSNSIPCNDYTRLWNTSTFHNSLFEIKQTSMQISKYDALFRNEKFNSCVILYYIRMVSSECLVCWTRNENRAFEAIASKNSVF